MARYPAPGERGSAVSYRDRYDHFIGGESVPPAEGGYIADRTPVTGEVFTEVARGTAEDVERALDAAHGAARRWGRTSAADRANVLNEIADRVEDHLEALAVAETWENGKPVRETLGVDLPLAVDRFRHFAGVVRAQEGGISQVGAELVAYLFPEPLGVVSRPVPWNSPLLAAAWELAPALAAGNAVVLEPAEQAPASLHVLVDLIADLLPPGVVNVVTGPTGGTATSGRCPGIFFADVAAHRDAFYDSALQDFATFALDLVSVQSAIRDQLLADATERVKAIRQGHPLDTATTIGPLACREHLDRTMSHIETARSEGVLLVCGGERVDLGGELSGGYYVMPTIFEGRTRDRAGEIFGPVVSVVGFDDFDDAVKAADDSGCGGIGVWSRDAGVAFRAGRRARARRVWVNNVPSLLEDRRVEDYQRTKTILVDKGF